MWRLTAQVGAPSHPKTTATPLLPDSDGHVHQHCDTRPNHGSARQLSARPIRNVVTRQYQQNGASRNAMAALGIGE